MNLRRRRALAEDCVLRTGCHACLGCLFRSSLRSCDRQLLVRRDRNRVHHADAAGVRQDGPNWPAPDVRPDGDGSSYRNSNAGFRPAATGCRHVVAAPPAPRRVPPTRMSRKSSHGRAQAPDLQPSAPSTAPWNAPPSTRRAARWTMPWTALSACPCRPADRSPRFRHRIRSRAGSRPSPCPRCALRFRRSRATACGSTATVSAMPSQSISATHRPARLPFTVSTCRAGRVISTGACCASRAPTSPISRRRTAATIPTRCS